MRFAFKINELFVVDGHPLGDGDPARGCTLEPLRNFPLPMVMLDERRGELKLAHPTETVPAKSSELCNRSTLPTSATPGAWSLSAGTWRNTHSISIATWRYHVDESTISARGHACRILHAWDVTWRESCVCLYIYIYIYYGLL